VSAQPDESARLRRSVEEEARKMKKAEQDRRTLLSQTVYLGTVGLLFALPLVGGAYLGLWLDERMGGYSVQWTMGMIGVGLVVGVINVYFFIRE
jgi:ATP synthase protein I